MDECHAHHFHYGKCLSDYTQLEIVEHFEGEREREQMKTRMHIMQTLVHLVQSIPAYSINKLEFWVT